MSFLWMLRVHSMKEIKTTRPIESKHRDEYDPKNRANSTGKDRPRDSLYSLEVEIRDDEDEKRLCLNQRHNNRYIPILKSVERKHYANT